MGSSIDSEQRSGVLWLLPSLFSCLSEIDPGRRQVALGLFSIALREAEASYGRPPFDHPFKVTPYALRTTLRGSPNGAPSTDLENLRTYMPRLPFHVGKLSSVGGAGLPLFEIIRALRRGDDHTSALWWVRSGQWSHFGLNESERWFVCRLMSAWFKSNDLETGSTICDLGIAISKLNAKCETSVARESSLQDLLRRENKTSKAARAKYRGSECPPHLLTALRLMEEAGAIGGLQGEYQIDYSKLRRFGAKANWMKATISLIPRSQAVGH